ncbi:MAG: 3-keto-disaccharide hydrolase [Planctomycetaceae bacterium]
MQSERAVERYRQSLIPRDDFDYDLDSYPSFRFAKDAPIVRALYLLVFTLHAAALLAQSPEPPPQGFDSLIDPSSMKGWRGSVQDWKVVNGELVGTADGSLKSNRFIVAEIEPVQNFEMQVDVWISAGGNSGLQYRSVEQPDLGPFVVTGYQCDVVSNRPEYNGMLYEERGRRILALTGQRVVVDEAGQPWITAQHPVPTFAPEQWHRYRVRVEGNHHRHWIDDTLTVDVIDLDSTHRRQSGVLGVQVHVGPPMTVRYRNFFLKRLPEDLPIIAAADPAASIPDDAEPVEPQGGWKNKPRPTRVPASR